MDEHSLKRRGRLCTVNPSTLKVKRAPLPPFQHSTRITDIITTITTITTTTTTVLATTLSLSPNKDKRTTSK